MTSARVDDNLILNSLTAVVAIIDNAGVITAVNDAWRHFAQENHAGSALLDGVGLNYLETCRQAARDPAATEAVECLQGMLAVLQGAQTEFELEYPCHAPDRKRWFLLRALPLRDATGLLVAHFNITERKRMEQSLHESREALTASEARFRMIADTMPSILVGVDLTGHVTEWNQEAERVTGVPAAAARGQAVNNLLPQYPALPNRIAEMIRRRRSAPVERMVTEWQGEFHYADVVIYPLLVGAEAVGAVIRIDDLTARVQLEQMLLQTEKMLSVGGLAAGMAHELNNPLGVILQGSQNILRRLSPDLPRNQRLAAALGAPLEQVRAYLEQSRILSFLENMAGAARRAARIVADMQSFTERGHAGFEWIRLEDMLDTAAQWLDSDRHLKQQCDLRRITIVRDYAGAQPVRCNRVAIEQVLLNVLKNAVQAMTGGGRPGPHRLTLRTRQEDNGVRAEVEDNGPGIDAKTRRHLFEPFFTTKPAGVGTGLGLSVSYFIVHQQHGGAISVRSIPGKGACFIIQLPARPKSR